MGLGSFLKGVANVATGVFEVATGTDIPGLGLTRAQNPGIVASRTTNRSGDPNAVNRRRMTGNGSRFTETERRRQAQEKRRTQRPEVFGPPRRQSNGGMPMNGNGLTDDGCLVPYYEAEFTQRVTCRKGYVAVTVNGRTVCMRRDLAIKQKLWKPAPKPPVTAAEGKLLRKAARIDRKVERLVADRNKVVGDRPFIKKPRSSGR